jgi:phage-related minor tail protein
MTNRTKHERFRAIMVGIGGPAGLAPMPVLPAARGAVFQAGRVLPLAMGGIVTRPTLLPLATVGTTALIGEAGPEAVLPLARGASGKLGVQTSGAGGGGDVYNQAFDFRGTSAGAVADAMNAVYAAARRDVFKELARSPATRRSLGMRGGVR